MRTYIGPTFVLLGLALAACTQAPASLNDNPATITPIDYFILRASQAGTAEILAENCPRYRFDTRKEEQLKKLVTDRVGRDKSLPETAEFIQGLVDKAASETQRYALEYQQRNKIDANSTAADFCRVADLEVRNQSIIGQLLKK